MSTPNNSSRARIIKAALKLFLSQGTSETTTKQIAELAKVNEVTIFRQFKSKYGLLLAVVEESGIFTNLAKSLIKSSQPNQNLTEKLRNYGNNGLERLEQFPELVCSLIGEASQYPQENREALGRGITEVNSRLIEYLASIFPEEGAKPPISPEKLAGLLNTMLLGYGVIEFTCESHQLWSDRTDFLNSVITLCTNKPTQITPRQTIRDLQPDLVHLLLQKAKKHSKQAYALVYILFGAGITPQEVVQLERSHYLSYPKGQLLEITKGNPRQVPINQSILGKRYGSYLRNPLTQWLKSRQDDYPALLLNSEGEPLSESDLYEQWQELVTDLPTTEGNLPTLMQAQQTWCVEMLMRGMSLENLQLLSGWDLAQLEPYAQRAKEKAALAQAFLLDQ